MDAAHRRYKKDPHAESDRYDPFPSSRVVPATADQAIGDPSAKWFGNPKCKERKRSIKSGLHDVELAHCYQIVGQPSHQYIPVVIKTKESQAYADQVAIEQSARCGTRRVRCCRVRSHCSETARENREPWCQPEERREA